MKQGFLEDRQVQDGRWNYGYHRFSTLPCVDGFELPLRTRDFGKILLAREPEYKEFVNATRQYLPTRYLGSRL